MIDLHCHLDLYPNPAGVVAECRLRQVFVVSVTTTPAAFNGTSALVREGDRIETALGLHPQLAGQRFKEVDLFDQHLPKVRWVGEIGLDGTPECRAFWPAQIRVFEHILRSCCTAGGRLLSIHSRAAAKEVIETLRHFPGSGVPVLHWFSGSVSELDSAISLGCWFSVGLPMLRSKKGRGIVSRIPRERVLTETDGPFVEEGGKPAEPWEVFRTERELAAVWGTTEAEVGCILANNLATLRAGGHRLARG